MDGLNKFPEGDFQAQAEAENEKEEEEEKTENFLRIIFFLLPFAYLLHVSIPFSRTKTKIIYWSVDNVQNCTQVSFFPLFL